MLAFIHGLLLALLFFDIVFSSHLHSRHTNLLKDSHEVPMVSSRVGSAHLDFLVTLRIGLKQSQFDELEEQLYEGWSTSLLNLNFFLLLSSLRMTWPFTI